MNTTDHDIVYDAGQLFYSRQLFSRVEFISLTVFNLVVALSGAVGNSVLIILFFRYTSLRTVPCIYLIEFLAVADLINCIGNVSYSVSTGWMIQGDTYYFFNRAQCLALSVLCIAGLGMSQIMTFAIAVDRALAFRTLGLYMAKNHRRFATRWFVFACVAAAFGSALTFAGVDLTSTPDVCNMGGSATWPPAQATFGAFAGGITFAIFGTYAVALRLMLRRIGERPATVVGATDTLSRQMKATRTVTLILALFLVLWVVPNAAMIVFLSIDVDVRQYRRASLYVGHAACLCSAANPYFYAWRHRDIRAHLRQLLAWRKAAPAHSGAQQGRGTN